MDCLPDARISGGKEVVKMYLDEGIYWCSTAVRIFHVVEGSRFSA